jgi:hypothetical protein
MAAGGRSAHTGRHMEKNPLNKGVLTRNSAGIGPVTREMVQARTRELALIAGRVPSHVTQADYQQAKRELTGESDADRQDALLDSLPEAKRWDPVPGSAGHQAPESPSEDEDDEGRNESAQLVNEGVNEAERDQMLQAARAAGKKDRPVP